MEHSYLTIEDIRTLAILELRMHCERSLTGCSSEMVARDLLMQGFLRQGLHIEVPGNRPLTRKNCWLENGKIETALVLRETNARSFDLGVVRPKTHIEIQCRSIFGTTSAGTTAAFLDDVMRVKSGFADLFLFICDDALYLPLSGIKDNRGRKPLEDISRYFPHIDHVGEQIVPVGDMLVRRNIVRSPIKTYRVITDLMRLPT